MSEPVQQELALTGMATPKARAVTPFEVAVREYAARTGKPVDAVGAHAV